MLITDDPNYVTVLKRIAQHLHENQVESLLLGREGIIKQWIDSLLERKAKLVESLWLFLPEILILSLTNCLVITSD